MNTIKLVFILHTPQQCPIQYLKLQFVLYLVTMQIVTKLKLQPPNFQKPSSTCFVSPEIPGNLLQPCIKLIKEPLIHIYNVIFFFKSSVCPDMLKILKVKLLHKKEVYMMYRIIDQYNFFPYNISKINFNRLITFAILCLLDRASS